MKKTIVFLVGLFVCGLLVSTASAGVDVQLGWDQVTHRASGTVDAPVCDVSGEALTPEEIASTTYRVSYRVKASGAAWTNVDTTELTVTLENLPYNTVYEAALGAYLPGGTIGCSTELLEFSTGVGPPPGPCQGFKRIIPGP